MQLVEQHYISKNDPRYAIIDEAAFKSKNLYNAANYEIRQSFIHEATYLDYNEIQRRMQSHEEYKALPAKVIQQVLRRGYNHVHARSIGTPRAEDSKQVDADGYEREHRDNGG